MRIFGHYFYPERAFELAKSDTLFLDKIGCVPQPMLVKLLSVLQERTVSM